MTEDIAIFIDGENIAHRHASAIMRIAAPLGRLILFRIYGDLTKLPGWMTHPGMTAVHSGCGKNAADMRIAIDATEFSYAQPRAGIVLVTSDSDFTPLALRLRERGHQVTGIGDHRATEGFRAACSIFHELATAEVQPHVPPEQLGDSPHPIPAAPKPVSAPPTGHLLDRQIRSAITQYSKDGRGLHIGRIGPLMLQNHGVQITTLKEKRWRDYLAGRPTLYDLDPKGPDAHVRFLPQGFAALPL